MERIISQDDKVLEILNYIYIISKQGYIPVKILKNELSKRNLTKELLQALKNEKIVKYVNEHYLWSTEIPTQEMAEKIYDSYLKLKKSSKNIKIIQEIPANLKPIVKNINMKNRNSRESTIENYYNFLVDFCNKKQIINLEINNLLNSYKISKQTLSSMVRLNYVIRIKGKNNSTSWNISLIPNKILAIDLIRYNNATITKNDKNKLIIDELNKKYEKINKDTINSSVIQINKNDYHNVVKNDKLNNIDIKNDNIDLELAKAFYSKGDKEFALKILNDIKN